MTLSPLRAAVPAVVVALALGLAACGSDDKDENADKPATTPNGADLSAVKGYLTEHTARLDKDTTQLQGQAQEYYDLAKANNFDYQKMLDENRPEVERLVTAMQKTYKSANPAYEEMEGIVAGVPALAEYDVIIDAGSDGSDPENAVPFDLTLPNGKTLKKPGNFMFLTETSVFGTEEKFAAPGVKPDLNGDGKVEFGEAVPDANTLLATAKDFNKYAKELDVQAKKFQPSESDALTALVVMTPTMSEYFEAWKNSRFVAGENDASSEFVATSRLSDITDILDGLVLTYDGVKPVVTKADSQQAEQTQQSLVSLRDFAADLRDKEAGGTSYSAEQADTLGSEAQTKAEAIAGQISQAAANLNIELQE